MQLNDKIKPINSLVQKGELKQALYETANIIKQHPWQLNLFIKYAYLHEMAGNIEIAGLLFISLEQRFPNQYEAKAAFLKFCLRTNKLKKAAQKIENWTNKYGEQKSHLECQIKLMKRLWKFEEAKELTEKYIQRFPTESFGYVNLLNINMQLRPPNYREVIEAVAKKNKAKPHFYINQIISNLNGSYINAFKPNTKLNFTYTENSNQLLKSFFIKNPPGKDKELKYIFKTPLNKKAIQVLTNTAQFSKNIHQKFLAYLNKHPEWRDFQLVSDYLKINIQNIGLVAKPLNLKPLQNNKIDIVYTWCDDNDENFIKKLNRVQGSFHEKISPFNVKFRYQQMGEIKLSLLSIQRYFQQVNNIYIVTNQQKFDVSFLKSSFQDKIRFVDHTEIMPDNLTNAGVFNSNLIETFIWKIPGLSECFLYLNDDVMFGDYLKYEHLINKENIPYTTLIPYNFEKHKVVKDLLTLVPETSFYESCLYNSNQQFTNRFKIKPHLGPLHQIMIMTKTSCKQLYNIMQPVWEKSFFKDAIRGNNSVYTVMMYNWYALLKGYQVLGPYHLYRRRSLYFHNEIYAENVATIREVKPLFYCLNYVADDTSKKLMEELITELSY